MRSGHHTTNMAKRGKEMPSRDVQGSSASSAGCKHLQVLQGPLGRVGSDRVKVPSPTSRAKLAAVHEARILWAEIRSQINLAMPRAP